jgi:hypothetical protein
MREKFLAKWCGTLAFLATARGPQVGGRGANFAKARCHDVRPGFTDKKAIPTHLISLT